MVILNMPIASMKLKIKLIGFSVGLLLQKSLNDLLSLNGRTIFKRNGEIEMKEVSHNEWMNTVKKLNEEQPSVIDLVNQQIESYENEKEGRDE